MLNYQTFIDSINKIAEKYNTTVNSNISENLSKIYEISQKYQLTPGTEKDFNNAVTFFLYSVVKNSKVIDDAETIVSNALKNILIKYYEQNISDDELYSLLNIVYSYNKGIDEKYCLDITKLDSALSDDEKEKQILENIKNVFSGMFLMNPNDLSLSENGYAYKILENLRKQYVSYYNDKYTALTPKDENSPIYTTQERQFLIIYLFALFYTNLNSIASYNVTEYSTDNNFILYNLNQNKIINFFEDDNKVGHDLTSDPVSLKKYYYSLQIQNPLNIGNEYENLNIYLSYFEDQFFTQKLAPETALTSDIPSPCWIKIEDENGLQSMPYLQYCPESKIYADSEKGYYLQYPNSDEYCCILTQTSNNYGKAWTPVIDSTGKKNTFSPTGFVIHKDALFEYAKRSNSKILDIGFYYTSSSTESSETIVVYDSTDNPNLKILIDFNNIDNIKKNLPVIVSGEKIIDVKNINDVLNILSDMSYFSDSLLNINVSYIYDYYLNFYKIYYEFNTPSSISDISENNFNSLKNNEKRTYNDNESYYLNEKYNIHYFDFRDILIKSNNALFDICNKLLEEKGIDDYFPKASITTNKEYYTFSITVLYKEFNLEIRKIDASEIQNKIIAKIITDNNIETTNNNLLNNDFFSKVYSAESDIMLSDDELLLFKDLKTNDYIIRIGRESDLITYLEGTIIDYGIYQDEKKEIELLQNLYRETRDYFYKVLLNKAFINETYYFLYVNFFIVSYTIERFISSKLDNITNLNLYNNEDSSNFLESFGLSVLNKQIEENNFSDSLTYKKRIIADYNNLMSQKGSKGVIDEFFKIFNYNEDEIVIYKYLLTQKTEEILNTTNNISETNSLRTLPLNDTTQTYTTKKTPVFVQVPYNANNISYYIHENSKTAEDYGVFIASDKYWSIKDVPEETINEVLVSPQNTKYLGLQLVKSLYKDYVQTRYAMSLNKYLYDMNFDIVGNENTNIYSRLIASNLNFDGTEVELSIVTLYQIINLMFLFYIYFCEAKNNYLATQIELPNKKYYGINKNGKLSNIYSKLATSLSMNISDVKNIFTAPVIDIQSIVNGNILSATGSIYNTEFYLKNSVSSGSIVEPTTIDSNIVSDYNDAEKKIVTVSNLFSNIGESNRQSGFYYVYYTKNKNISYSDGKQHLFEKNQDYVNLENYCKEVLSSSETTTSIDAINSAFYSASYVNLLNNRAGATDKTFYNEILKAAYRLYKNGENDSYTSSAFISDNEIELENANFYLYIYSVISDYPLKYVLDNFQNNKDMNYTKDTHDILETVFNEFFITDSDYLGYFPENDFTENGTNDTLLKQLLNEIITSIDKTINSEVNKLSLKQTILSYISSLLPGISSITISETNEIDIVGTPLSKHDFSILLNTDSNYDKFNLLKNELLNLISNLNSILDLYENMKLNFTISEDVNNFFDFIKTSVEFFISYTANLYQTSLVFSYDNPTEHAQFSYKLEDKIQSTIYEYFFADDTATFKELSENIILK